MEAKVYLEKEELVPQCICSIGNDCLRCHQVGKVGVDPPHPPPKKREGRSGAGEEVHRLNSLIFGLFSFQPPWETLELEEARP